jgi:hypothetical protein
MAAFVFVAQPRFAIAALFYFRRVFGELRQKRVP